MVETICEPSQLLQDEADLLPVGIMLPVLFGFVSHPIQVLSREIARTCIDIAVRWSPIEVDRPHIPLVLLHALVSQEALQEASRVALVLPTVTFIGVNIKDRPPSLIDAILETPPGGRPSASPRLLQLLLLFPSHRCGIAVVIQKDADAFLAATCSWKGRGHLCGAHHSESGTRNSSCNHRCGRGTSTSAIATTLPWPSLRSHLVTAFLHNPNGEQ
mmetsp:Transcript_89194/g.186398  ORF Transcript_89194/g.186398 Transcript_89194/m.186398 type:complete len:216 (-) Transcript_89194:33-680(-)